MTPLEKIKSQYQVIQDALDKLEQEQEEELEKEQELADLTEEMPTCDG